MVLILRFIHPLCTWKTGRKWICTGLQCSHQATRTKNRRTFRKYLSAETGMHYASVQQHILIHAIQEREQAHLEHSRQMLRWHSSGLLRWHRSIVIPLSKGHTWTGMVHLSSQVAAQTAFHSIKKEIQSPLWLTQLQPVRFHYSR